MRSLLFAFILFLTTLAVFAEEATVPEQPTWMIYFTVAITALLGISEALSMIPAVKSNGVFQMIWNILKAIGGRE